MTKCSFLFLIEIVITLFFSNCYSQNEEKYFELQRVTGDLNNDKTKDIVIVYHDTINPKAPYRLEIYFAKVDSVGDVKVISTEKAIKPDFPDAETIDERTYSGYMFNQIEIKNNILLVRGHLTRGHYVHKYRFQNGVFELIGFAKTESDGQSVIEIIEFNLSTRKRIIKTEGFSSKQKPKIKAESIILTTLPKLGEFTPLENELY